MTQASKRVFSLTKELTIENGFSVEHHPTHGDIVRIPRGVMNNSMGIDTEGVYKFNLYQTIPGHGFIYDAERVEA